MRLVGFLFSLTACACLAGMSWAQPEIQNLNGDISHGETVVIYGQEFGVKDPAPPLRYDNFEDGELGTRLKGQDEGGWYTYTGSGLHAHYSQDRQRVPGEQCALQDYTLTSNKTIGLQYVDVDTLYMSGWTYRDDFNGTATYSENTKLWGNLCRYNGSYQYPQIRYDAYWNYDDVGHLYVANENQETWGSYFGGREYLDEWFRMEGYTAIGNPGEPNGVAWRSYNGDVFAEISGVFHETEATYNYWMIGQYFRRVPVIFDDLPTALLKVYWGELYVDNTLARIEIGDDPVFASCSHREIQIPETWDGGEASFTVNQGTFEQDADLYLFLVDSSGTPSEGFPITMNSQVAPNVPGKPGRPYLN